MVGCRGTPAAALPRPPRYGPMCRQCISDERLTWAWAFASAATAVVARKSIDIKRTFGCLLVGRPLNYEKTLTRRTRILRVLRVEFGFRCSPAHEHTCNFRGRSPAFEATKMKTAHDFDQELLILFDAYVHGGIDRRTFLDKATK